MDRRVEPDGPARAAAVKVAFVHPDLGLGGAERLVVDAARELRARGHRPVIVTAQHDPARAFPDTVDGSVDVRVAGRLVPGRVAGRLRAPCAIARMAWIASILPRRPARPGAAARPRAARRAPHLAVGDGAWRAAVGVPVARLGREGRRHVDAHFSRAAFGRRFEAALRTVLEGRCSAR